MRLFDRMASEDVVLNQFGKVNAEVSETAFVAALSATKVVADEAAQYVFQGGKIMRDVARGDFGCTRPPMKLMWIEWTPPKKRYNGRKWAEIAQQRHAVVVGVSQTGLEYEMQPIFGPLRRSDGPIAAAPILMRVRFDSTSPTDFGTLLIEAVQEEIDLVISQHQAREFGLTRSGYAEGLAIEYYPALLALGWMNCRNVQLRDSGPGLKLLKKRRKNRHFTGQYYKVLHLEDQARRDLKANRDAEKRDTRMHLVRGHFKYYTAEKPLFGKLTGHYWWHQQVRGDARLGQITNEYVPHVREALDAQR